jgi:hypothetical protein
MTDHCPACRVVRELLEHRDSSAGVWSLRRGVLNFAIVVARRACPAYEAQTVPGTTHTDASEGATKEHTDG